MHQQIGLLFISYIADTRFYIRLLVCWLLISVVVEVMSDGVACVAVVTDWLIDCEVDV